MGGRDRLQGTYFVFNVKPQGCSTLWRRMGLFTELRPSLVVCSSTALCFLLFALCFVLVSRDGDRLVTWPYLLQASRTGS